jgi:uncharacterized protein YkwD
MTPKNWSHDSFVPLAKSAGLNYLYLGENLGNNICAPNSLVEAWINSPTHKNIMLNPKYKYIGIGYHDRIIVTEYGDIK